MPKFSVLFARFPYQNQECPDTTDWLLRTSGKARRDPRIGEIYHQKFDDTPITMTRNQMIESAKQLGVDILCMVDSDMKPDCEPDGKPFWDTSLDFLLNHNGPCVIGAPYCGPPPLCSVYVFRWCNWQNPGHANSPDHRLEMFTREDAEARAGFEKVAALPTGLMLLDMRAIKAIDPPYFYYEWRDKTESQKASTEDVTFTRDLSLNGIPLYCNWDAWAGHWKRQLITKPKLIHVDQIRKKYVDAVLRNHRSNEKLIMVGEGGGELPMIMPTVAPKQGVARNDSSGGQKV